jgi:hypothetical protein
MKLNNNPDKQVNFLPEAKDKKLLIKNTKKTSQLLFIFVGSFCLFLLVNQAIWAQIESIYNSATDEVAGISGLMSAVTNNDIEGVKFFSKGGPLIINQKNLGGATALHIACRESNTEAVKILLENGANVNIADNEGWTPLMRASLVGNAQIVEMLIVKNAKADAFNSIGETALVHATNSRCLDCLNIIIEKANLIKTANLKTLKTQITDAFLLARNQEESSAKTVLEAFLDYVNKADNLLTTQIAETKPTEHLSESSLETSKSHPVKKLTINKKSGKKFALKTTAEHQEELKDIIKPKNSPDKPIATSKTIQDNKNSVKETELKLEQKTIPITAKPVKIAEKPKKSFKLKKPVEDAKNKIPTFTQQSLPPVVAPVNQDSPASTSISNPAVASSNSANQQENSPNNGLANENKSQEIADTSSPEIPLEVKPTDNEIKHGFFKRLFSKKSTIPQDTNNQKAESIQNEALKTQSVSEKSAETLQNSQEQLPEKSINAQPEINSTQNKLIQNTKSTENNLSKVTPNKHTKLENNTSTQEKLKKFKFSPLQDAKNKPNSASQNSQVKNNTNILQEDSATNKPETSLNNIQKSTEKESSLKRKYKLKAITNIENTDPEVEIKKLPAPQEI